MTPEDVQPEVNQQTGINEQPQAQTPVAPQPDPSQPISDHQPQQQKSDEPEMPSWLVQELNTVWSDLPEQERQALLSDPHQFRQFQMEIKQRALRDAANEQQQAQQQKQATQHTLKARIEQACEDAFAKEFDKTGDFNKALNARMWVEQDIWNRLNSARQEEQQAYAMEAQQAFQQTVESFYNDYADLPAPFMDILIDQLQNNMPVDRVRAYADHYRQQAQQGGNNVQRVPQRQGNMHRGFVEPMAAEPEQGNKTVDLEALEKEFRASVRAGLRGKKN